MGKDQDPSGRKKQNQYNSYLKYSGLAIQLVFTIGVAGWLGYLLDQYLGMKFPVFIVLFTFTAFGGVIFMLYRALNKDQE